MKIRIAQRIRQRRAREEFARVLEGASPSMRQELIAVANRQGVRF
ncbi:MAG TPA: hypothetical protein VK816_07300 [Jatrophihabitantaceae bacterium]|jgi:hypothetical protein|nr:hypothetical protein [Jatrophihabitantaceae bacterium]